MTAETPDGLGRLEPVAPRAVWANEALDFTPWLLEHPEDLGGVLGMELSLTAAEHRVGDFSLDLVGQDAATGERVIVENQLEASDHTHLGQLLTYAAGTDTANVVWVCTTFREEHRAALDWLNGRTEDGTRFFGVEVSVVRIGSSAPAPLFRLVSAPNDWGKQVRRTTSDRVSRANWGEEDFLEALAAYCDAGTAAAVLELMVQTRSLPGFAYYYWGSGRYPSVTAIVKGPQGKTQPWTVSLAPDGGTVLALNYDWLHKQGRAFDEDAVARFAAKVSVLPGVGERSAGAGDAGWRRRPSIPARPLFDEPSAVPTLVQALQRLYAG